MSKKVFFFYKYFVFLYLSASFLICAYNFSCFFCKCLIWSSTTNSLPLYVHAQHMWGYDIQPGEKIIKMDDIWGFKQKDWWVHGKKWNWQILSDKKNTVSFPNYISIASFGIRNFEYIPILLQQWEKVENRFQSIYVFVYSKLSARRTGNVWLNGWWWNLFDHRSLSM